MLPCEKWIGVHWRVRLKMSPKTAVGQDRRKLIRWPDSGLVYWRLSLTAAAAGSRFIIWEKVTLDVQQTPCGELRGLTKLLPKTVEISAKQHVMCQNLSGLLWKKKTKEKWQSITMTSPHVTMADLRSTCPGFVSQRQPSTNEWSTEQLCWASEKNEFTQCNVVSC